VHGESTFQRAIAFAADLIRIPSPSGLEGDVARRVMSEMEALGFDDAWTDAFGNVIGRVRGRGESPPLMLCSHLDVVDEGDPAGWEHPPYGGIVAGGWLHGRGAADVKGALALQVYAAGAFVRERPAGDVYVAGTVMEERGGWGMAHLMRAGEVSPAVVILGEATGGDLCIGHRGHAELEIEIRGLAGHASAPDRARNPAALLPHVLQVLEQMAAGLPSDPVLGVSTLAPTVVETEPRSRNAVPELARVVVDWRVLPGWDEESEVEALRARLDGKRMEGVTLEVRAVEGRQRSYTGLEEQGSLFTPGFLLDPGHPLVRTAARVVAAARGRPPTVRSWAFATDGGYSCGVHGVPTLGYAPGAESFAHTNRERLPLDEAEEVFDTYPALIRALLGTLPRSREVSMELAVAERA
jgi:putative selenium metabolism hydrolase